MQQQYMSFNPTTGMEEDDDQGMDFTPGSVGPGPAPGPSAQPRFSPPMNGDFIPMPQTSAMSPAPIVGMEPGIPQVDAFGPKAPPPSMDAPDQDPSGQSGLPPLRGPMSQAIQDHMMRFPQQQAPPMWKRALGIGAKLAALGVATQGNQMHPMTGVGRGIDEMVDGNAAYQRKVNNWMMQDKALQGAANEEDKQFRNAAYAQKVAQGAKDTETLKREAEARIEMIRAHADAYRRQGTQQNSVFRDPKTLDEMEVQDLNRRRNSTDPAVRELADQEFRQKLNAPRLGSKPLASQVSIISASIQAQHPDWDPEEVRTAAMLEFNRRQAEGSRSSVGVKDAKADEATARAAATRHRMDNPPTKAPNTTEVDRQRKREAATLVNKVRELAGQDLKKAITLVDNQEASPTAKADAKAALDDLINPKKGKQGTASFDKKVDDLLNKFTPKNGKK